ncbi:hypothetical protein [Pseudorhodobacter antarcticus]|uniref:hypothetical protein n=1 Tax=Pseudorhodobacter antarcticus TaxID=1077947 RepID=UPI000A4A4795|nr:hypothetical protein [Pseudorhodobacter antarcticus]
MAHTNTDRFKRAFRPCFGRAAVGAWPLAAGRGDLAGMVWLLGISPVLAALLVETHEV